MFSNQITADLFESAVFLLAFLVEMWYLFVLQRSDTMTTLENLYNGNINPCELERSLL